MNNNLSKYMQAYCLIKAITRSNYSQNEKLKRLFFLREKSRILPHNEYLAIESMTDLAMRKLVESN